jgi:hypothetical protein
VGLRFGERQDELKKLLDLRNKTILAHGFHPASRKTNVQMLGITMDFLGMNEEMPSGFPQMRWQEGVGV